MKKDKDSMSIKSSSRELGLFPAHLSVHRWVFTEIGTQCPTWERKTDPHWVLQSSYWFPACNFSNSAFLPLPGFPKATATKHAKGQKLATYSLVIMNFKTLRHFNSVGSALTAFSALNLPSSVMWGGMIQAGGIFEFQLWESWSGGYI